MEATNNTLIDPDLVALESWFNLLSNDNFSVLREYINRRIENCRLNVDTLSREPSQDNLIKITHFLAKQEELKNMLSYFDRKLKEKAQKDKERISVSTK